MNIRTTTSISVILHAVVLFIGFEEKISNKVSSTLPLLFDIIVRLFQNCSVICIHRKLELTVSGKNFYWKCFLLTCIDSFKSDLWFFFRIVHYNEKVGCVVYVGATFATTAAHVSLFETNQQQSSRYMSKSLLLKLYLNKGVSKSFEIESFGCAMRYKSLTLKKIVWRL